MASLLKETLRLLGTLLLAGFLGASLIRFAPGFGVNELELDSRLSSDSIERLRQDHAGQSSIAAYYFRYLTNLAHGDLGQSETFARPNADLLRERLPLTLESLAGGLSIGWSAGLILAILGILVRIPGYPLATAALSGAFLCMPAALVALACFRLGAPVALGIAVVVFPKVFRYSHELLRQSANLEHVVTARAKGLGPLRIFFFHILPSAAQPLLALSGVSLAIGLGATIPVEVLCDSPGIGQLAWKAALGRDLSLLVGLTLVITAMTLAANFIADLAGSRLKRSGA